MVTGPPTLKSQERCYWELAHFLAFMIRSLVSLTVSEDLSLFYFNFFSIWFRRKLCVRAWNTATVKNSRGRGLHSPHIRLGTLQALWWKPRAEHVTCCRCAHCDASAQLLWTSASSKLYAHNLPLPPPNSPLSPGLSSASLLKLALWNRSV